MKGSEAREDAAGGDSSPAVDTDATDVTTPVRFDSDAPDDAEERPFRITVWAWDLDEAAQDALFDRVADAAHALDESVMCSGSLADDEEDE